MTLDYSFVFTSDPQYPWTYLMDQVTEPQTETEEEQKIESERLIRAQYQSISAYNQSIGGKVTNIFINGDITAYGHGWQWEKMEEMFTLLNAPYSYGLGNHDIENNFGDTFLDNAWINSFMNSWRFRPQHLISKDTWEENYVFGDHKYCGSLNYTQKLGDFRTIVANNYPTMTGQASLYDPSNFTDVVYWLTEGMDYIERELEAARIAEDPVLLFVHKPDGWDWNYDANEIERFQSLVEKYYDLGVLKAAFVGHFHAQLGLGNAFGTHRVPIYFTGGATYQSYLIGEVENTGGRRELKLYTVTGNNWQNKTLIETFLISEDIPEGEMTEEEEVALQEKIAQEMNLMYETIRSIDTVVPNRVLDDSDYNDDVICFNWTAGKNQQWQVYYDKRYGAFVFDCNANNFGMYESPDQYSGGYSKVMTRYDLNPNIASNRLWRLFPDGISPIGRQIYKIRNQASGKFLTLQSPSNEASDAPTAQPLITREKMENTDLQQFTVTPFGY